MIGDITATAEIGKTYLGTVVRLADFGAFVEVLPGTDGLLHISEVAEHRIKDVRDELKEGDQILVKVLSIEGNRIRLSRKAILKEQRAKMEGGEAGAEQAQPAQPTTFEGGHEGEEEDDGQLAVGIGASEGGARPERQDRGGDRGGRGRGPRGGGHHGGRGGRGGDRGGRGRGPRGGGGGGGDRGGGNR
jgi:polyribonucleotide nucleotidyltransferase